MQTTTLISSIAITIAIAATVPYPILHAADPSGGPQPQESREPPADNVSNNKEKALPIAGSISEESMKLLAELDRFDPLDPRRADVLEQLARQSRTTKERNVWYQQVADTLTAAVQTGAAPQGIELLRSLFQRLQKDKADQSLLAYVMFRLLSAEHAQNLQAPHADLPVIQSEFHKNLEAYITDYPTAPDSAEAMLQLGIAQELVAQEDGAKRWYRRIVAEFPASPAAAKGAGAILRLESIGKTIPLSGKSLTGGTVQLSDYRGKVVLIHFWATWSKSSKTDHAVLKHLAATHGPRFTVVGVSLDNDVKDLNRYLAENTLPWPQIAEAGGMDSPPANQWGIFFVPTMILVNQEGQVVHRAISPNDVEAELKKLLR
jgi:thiol-disulfide isomerase/thioredoxin